MLKHSGQLINAYNYAKTVHRSVSALHTLQELTDNSIQYKSDETGIIIDSFKNRVIAMDTGTGIPIDIFCDNYHTFHNTPKDVTGISMAGLGSKLFYKLSDTRITLTRHKGEAYYSIWSFDTIESFNNPTMAFLDPDDMPELLREHKDIVRRFVALGVDCTFTILPDIRSWGKHRNSSEKFYNALKDHYEDRYGHFLKKNQINMVVSYVNDKDQREWYRIKYADVSNSGKYNSVLDKSGQIEIRSWIVNPHSEQAKLTKSGINIYRNDIKAVTTEYKNIGKRKKKGRSVSVVRAEPRDYKSIRQAIFFKSESDDKFTINHIKTQVEFEDFDIEVLCAKEFQKITEEYEKQRTQHQQQKLSDSDESSETTFAIADLVTKTAWKITDGEISFNKSSAIYKTIESMPEDGIDLIKNILTSLTPRQINKLGVELETTTGGKNVQQVA